MLDGAEAELLAGDSPRILTPSLRLHLQEPEENCWQVPHENCWEETVQKCWTQPQEQCHQVRHQSPDQLSVSCSICPVLQVEDQKCDEVPQEHCKEVPVKVARKYCNAKNNPLGELSDLVQH